MAGIARIASYLPAERLSNEDRAAAFGTDAAFVREKLGVLKVARRAAAERTSDLCVAAYRRLERSGAPDPERIGALVVVTQNPDTAIPHTAAIVHGKLGLPESCATFDVSLGCSGFVHGLSVTLAFLEANGIAEGLLFTADPYSGILDPEDRNTALLFGDAAAVTHLTSRPAWRAGRFTFGTSGAGHADLTTAGGRLAMNGRSIFTFALTRVPGDIRRLLELNGLAAAEVDAFVFHQASRYMVENIAARLGLEPRQVVWGATEYGNTVSSSVPIVLEGLFAAGRCRRIVICGFGAGLAWSSGVLFKTEED